MSEWIRVTKSRVCPACGKPDWCTLSKDGESVCCMRIESNRVMKNGGWLHKSGEKWDAEHKRTATEFAPRIDWDRLQKIYRSNLNGHLATIAESLGVTRESLDSLGMGWDGDAATFPMKNAASETVGIRRRFEDGKKRAVTGSRDGLFFAGLCDGMFVCEGPSDAAALLSIGIIPLGRPHCMGGALEIEAIFHEYRIEAVIADNDPPGTRGANALAKQIGVRVIHPPDGIKDVRAWVNAGAKRSDVIG